MKPNKPLSPEWMYLIRIIATLTLATLVFSQDPELGRMLLLEVAKSLVL